MSCYGKVQKYTRPTCIEEGDGLVEGIYVGKQGAGITLPAPNQQGESDESRLARAIATRLAATDDTEMFFIPIFEGTIPAPTTTYKTNPQSGKKTASKTDYKMTWTEWDDSLVTWDWLRTMTGSDEVTQKVAEFNFWLVQGNNLIGGLAGYSGSLSALPSVENGNETPSRVACEINWTVKGQLYRKVKLS